MKALTLTQPWATLVAVGAKRIETRSWVTSYTGPLAIHAAKGFPKDAQDLVLHDWEFYSALQPDLAAEFKANGERLVPRQAGHSAVRGLPRGAVVATCFLVDCLSTVYQAPRGFSVFERYPNLDTVTEREFGDYSPGRYAWVVDGVKPLAHPIPARGALGLWEWRP